MTTGTMGDDDGLLTEQDAAELLHVQLSTLRRPTMVDRCDSSRLA